MIADCGLQIERGPLLAGITALYVARPLLPSEASLTAHDGEGLPWVLLHLVLAIGWLTAAVLRRQWRVRVGWTEAGWVVLLAAYGASACWAARDGDGRPAINLLGEWLALALGYFLVRQLVATAREARAVVAVMIGLAAALSGFGLYEFAVSRPADREAYRRDPEGMLRRAGIDAPPGSPTRLQFENRLASTEPIATFTLANSLAGFLAPWLVVAGGVAAGMNSVLRLDRMNSVLRAGAAACAMPIALCLMLTKSRSAWLATAAGLACLTVWMAFAARRRNANATAPATGKMALIFLAGAVSLAVLASTAIRVGALDRQVVTESFKSFGYRWQYWRATWAMIQDHFWLGCGPGNFQDAYTRYKLPEASETVADPHNFVFEIWATAGTPALVGLILVVAGAIHDFRRRPMLANAEPASESTPKVTPPRARAASAVRGGGQAQVDLAGWVLAGGVLGFVAAFFVGMSTKVPLGTTALVGGLASAAAAVALLSPWVRRGTLPAGLPLLGAAVLAVNLSAAGGICFPGVAGSLWLLFALAVNQRDVGPPRSPSHAWAVTALVCAMGLTIVFHQAAFLPVMQSRTFLWRAQTPRQTPEPIEALLVEAAEADPRADEPRHALADLAFEIWKEHPTAQRLAHWEQCQVDALTKRPMSSAAWQQAGERYVAAYQETHDARLLDDAIVHYRRAVELYPNKATLRGLLALALEQSRSRDVAAGEAARAIELDRLTPHLDQKLPPELRAKLLRFADQNHAE